METRCFRLQSSAWVDAPKHVGKLLAAYEGTRRARREAVRALTATWRLPCESVPEQLPVKKVPFAVVDGDVLFDVPTKILT